MTVVEEEPTRTPLDGGGALPGDDQPWLPHWTDIVDRLAASDPGLNRFRLATVTIVSITVALAAEYAFVHLTGALWKYAPAGAPAKVIAEIGVQHHAITVIAMLMGAIVGMMCGFGVTETNLRGQMITLAIIPIPVIAAMFAGLALSKHRIPALILITVALGIGVYLRRFGPRGFISGMLLFMGSFLGYFIGEEVTLSQGGWLVCFLAIGVLVSMVLRLTIFRPRPDRVLDRTLGSFRGRCRQVVARSLDLVEGDRHTFERDARRLRQRLVRLNEAALMIDAQMGDPASVRSDTDPERLHEGLFDVELGYQNLGRRVEILVRLGIPEPVQSPLRRALLTLSVGQLDEAELEARVLLDVLRARPDLPDQPAAYAHRIAVTILALVEDARSWQETIQARREDHEEHPYQTSVVLMMGNLAGSALVSQAVSGPSGSRPWQRLGPQARAAVQITVATAVAIAIADQVSGRRYYWAVIAVMVCSMGTNTAGEKVTKAFNRVLGTLIGIVIGSLLVHAVGSSGWLSLVVILAALYLGLYLMRISYVFMTIGITTMISQLYLQLDEFANSLLVLRLEETAIGAAVAVVAALVVFPVSTRRALRKAISNYLVSLTDVVRGATAVFAAEPAAEQAKLDLRSRSRTVDDNLQQVLITLRPLRRNPFGTVRLRDNASILDATAHQARNLAGDAVLGGPVDEAARRAVGSAGHRIADAVAAMAAFAEGDHDATYHRSSAALDRIERHFEDAGVPWLRGDRLHVHHLQRIDRMMADLARQVGMTTVDDSETGPIVAPAPPPPPTPPPAPALPKTNGSTPGPVPAPTPAPAPAPAAAPLLHHGADGDRVLTIELKVRWTRRRS